MLTRIGFYEFCEIMDNTYNGSSFDREGLMALFDYLEELYELSDEEYILDPVGICCNYSQMSFDEFCNYYPVDILDDDKKQSALDYIEYHSILVGHTDNSVVFHSF